MDKKPRTLICMKAGSIKAFYYGDTLLGAATNEGDYRVDLGFSHTKREKEILLRQMALANLNCGWCGKVSTEGLEEVIYKAWMREFAAHARERMAGE
ncbi:MAG: hypothetical protein M3Q39_01655 [Actinomycetota bacterium]|nr:hypothetical protein [Actinomycetota bacterium]